MIHVGIDIGKLKHCFCIIDYSTGEELVTPTFFENNQSGFRILSRALAAFPKDSLLIGMEDTGHYHFALLRSLIAQGFNVALMNPTTTDFERKRQGSTTKNDKLDTITIGSVKSFSQIGLQASGKMKSVGNGGILNGSLQMLHIHVLFVTPLGTSHMA